MHSDLQRGGGAAVAYRTSSTTAKAATDAPVRSAAVELGPFGFRVNSVQPGLVPSDLTADISETAPWLRGS